MKSKIFILITLVILLTVFGFFYKYSFNRLSQDRIKELRAVYPTVDENPVFVDSLVPEDWGANFELVFDRYDAVVRGKMTSDVYTTQKNITMVDLNDWEGDLEKLEELNPSLINSSVEHIFWTLEVDEVIWQSENASKKVEIGDKLLMTDSTIMFNYEEQLKKDNYYVLPLSYSEKQDAWTFLKPGGFYVTDDGYMFSFKSGHNTNQFTGSKERVYVNALKRANKKWEKEVKAGTYVERIDYLDE